MRRSLVIVLALAMVATVALANAAWGHAGCDWVYDPSGDPPHYFRIGDEHDNTGSSCDGGYPEYDLTTEFDLKQGNDASSGNDGIDLMYGGVDNDHLFGNQDNDRLWGEGGDDVLRGNTGNDRLDGGAGNDDCVGGDGADTLIDCNP